MICETKKVPVMRSGLFYLPAFGSVKTVGKVTAFFGNASLS